MAKNDTKGKSLAELGIQTCQVVRVQRSQIEAASYNPRILSEKAKGKLATLLDKHGLVDLPVWNVRTGTLVGGHQRLKALDKKLGHVDYSLDVQQVDISLEQEKALNVALNNDAAMGEYDLDALSALCKDLPDLSLTGLNVADLTNMTGDMPVVADASAMEEIADQVEKTHDMREKVLKKLSNREDPYYFRVLVFQDGTEAAAMDAALGLEPRTKCYDGRELAKALGYDLPAMVASAAAEALAEAGAGGENGTAPAA